MLPLPVKMVVFYRNLFFTLGFKLLMNLPFSKLSGAQPLAGGGRPFCEVSGNFSH